MISLEFTDMLFIAFFLLVLFSISLIISTILYLLLRKRASKKIALFVPVFACIVIFIVLLAPFLRFILENEENEYISYELKIHCSDIGNYSVILPMIKGTYVDDYQFSKNTNSSIIDIDSFNRTPMLLNYGLYLSDDRNIRIDYFREAEVPFSKWDTKITLCNSSYYPTSCSSLEYLIFLNTSNPDLEVYIDFSIEIQSNRYIERTDLNRIQLQNGWNSVNAKYENYEILH